MERIDQLADDIVELKVMVTKIDSAVHYSLEADRKRDDHLLKLTDQMDLALIPIRYFKTSLTIAAGSSVFIGCVYGVLQLWQHAANLP